MTNADIVNAILASRTTCSAAYDRVLPEIKALPAKRVRTVNLDVPRTVSRVLGALPRILALRDDIEEKTRDNDFLALQKIETYAYAAQEAYVRSLSAGKTPDELRALGEEGDSLRALLRGDTATLVRRGQLDASQIVACQGQPGYKTIATDLGLIAEVMLANWDRINCKTCVSEAELHRAKAIADALLAFVGARELTPEARDAAVDIRDRSFTLLVDSYEPARRVVTYVRWYEGDADQIAPSLYGGRHRAAKNHEKADTDDEHAHVDAVPSMSSASEASLSAPATNPFSANVSVGKPNSNPFMH